MPFRGTDKHIPLKRSKMTEQQLVAFTGFEAFRIALLSITLGSFFLLTWRSVWTGSLCTIFWGTDRERNITHRSPLSLFLEILLLWAVLYYLHLIGAQVCSGPPTAVLGALVGCSPDLRDTLETSLQAYQEHSLVFLVLCGAHFYVYKDCAIEVKEVETKDSGPGEDGVARFVSGPPAGEDGVTRFVEDKDSPEQSVFTTRRHRRTSDCSTKVDSENAAKEQAEEKVGELNDVKASKSSYSSEKKQHQKINVTVGKVSYYTRKRTLLAWMWIALKLYYPFALHISLHYLKPDFRLLFGYVIDGFLAFDIAKYVIFRE
ncbi:unnamed protein product [Amoebophrya sp. A25]|nr:unnamed protein product [Amoebophrya sp. A25]|eukprot:GSA25T00024486001.1